MGNSSKFEYILLGVSVYQFVSKILLLNSRNRLAVNFPDVEKTLFFNTKSKPSLGVKLLRTQGSSLRNL